MCVPAVSPFVLVVTVLFSDVTVVCEVVFSNSDCEFVQPQTFSRSREREASVAFECETEVNFEGPPVRAVPASVRRSPTPQSAESVGSRAPQRLGKGPSVNPLEVNDMEVDE